MNNNIVHTGIIPYYYDSKTNSYYLFLSEERNDTKRWCGFAGRREKGESIIDASAREGWEESMGLLGNQSELLVKIKEAKLAIFSKKGKKTSLQYLIECDKPTYLTLADNFNNVISYCDLCNTCNNNSNGCYEKVRGRWFALDKLIKSAVTSEEIEPGIGYLRDLFDITLLEGKLISI